MPERVAHILADYANEVRKLAYTLPSGVAETEALRLSKQMANDADLWLSEVPPHAATCRPPARPSETPSALGRPRPGIYGRYPLRQNPSEG